MLAKYTLDRIVDGQTAVLLRRDGETKEENVAVKQLPSNAKEGDILEVVFDQDGTMTKAVILKQETAVAKKRVSSLMEKLKNKKKK